MKKNKPKYIFVTGGVLSGLGKGITAASIGNLLKSRGLKVNMQKFDQYINVDAGTLNPAEHGEVFVTDDGGETDLDLGHYERFLDQNLTEDSSVMTGEVYQAVINRERRGEYLGKTVQVIPHLTDEVKRRARGSAEGDAYDVHIVEIGGTVGDNEGFHFIEAARQMRLDVGPENVLYVHVVFLPHLKASGEVKTKPAQNSVRELRSIGIQPDILIARTDHTVSRGMIEKMSLYSNVEPEAILPLITAESVYEVPGIMEKNKLDDVIMKKLSLKPRPRKNTEWDKLVTLIKKPKERCSIALVGKYTTMLDTYASLIEALKAAAWHNNRDINIRWVDAEAVEKDGAKVYLEDAAGIVVPGGFGVRGTEGKIQAIEYARTKKVPYLGLCLGMQLATIEYARNVAGISQATSEEFLGEISSSRTLRADSEALSARSPRKRGEKAEASQRAAGASENEREDVARQASCVIHIMEDQKTITDKGGTMRLGGWDCVLEKGSFSYEAYVPHYAKATRGSNRFTIRERHRHRYEFNNDFRDQLTKAGFRIAGTTPDGRLVEVVEAIDHPWFVGVQFHPEFTSRPLRGHPLFNAFIKATLK